MTDFNRRVNSIVVKNLPLDFTTNQLEDLFHKFGKIISSKILPHNPNFEGGCGFVNYADAESCNQAVENMNNYVVRDKYTLRVSRSTTSNFDRPQNGFRPNSETNTRTFSSDISSPNIPNGFRSASVIQPKPISFNELNGHEQQQQQQQQNIQEHESFVLNKIYNVYLSNLEVPNVVFTATLDDYVNATLLITQMNKHEQLSKVQANSLKSKLSVGQACAARFNGDWYRARVLEIGESRVRVEYIDWGNKGWCDPILEIRPLPNEYYKDPVLCVKCVLDGVPSTDKLSDEQKNAILGILVLDLKLEMTVIRIENGLPYIRLNLGERNLNNEIRTLLSSSNSIKQELIINFDSNKLDLNLSETHFVQLTTVDTESECFYVLLMRDSLVTIMNVLKDWNANKQPLTIQPKVNMLVCAQYDADDLWYRAWIKNIDNGYRVYFVDFGNEEIVSRDRLSECPEILRNIPWQCVKIKLANIKLTNEERYILLRDFETDRLDMKILQKNQDIYLVDLIHNGKSIVEHILELRKKQPIINNEVPKIPVEPVQQSIIIENSRPPPNSTILDAPKKPLFTVTKSESTTNEQKTDASINDNLISLISEQRRQNRLLEQVIAAINTTNALLTQLVQR